MYNGSTLSFLGTALWYVPSPPPRFPHSPPPPLCPTDRSHLSAYRYGSPAGVILSVFVFLIYRVALYFEESVPPPAPSSRLSLAHALTSRDVLSQAVHGQDLRRAREAPGRGGRARAARGELGEQGRGAVECGQEGLSGESDGNWRSG